MAIEQRKYGPYELISKRVGIHGKYAGYVLLGGQVVWSTSSIKGNGAKLEAMRRCVEWADRQGVNAFE